MIKTGLSLNVDGTWCKSQLFGRVQEIISEYRVHFNGKPVYAENQETKTESGKENDDEDLE